MSLNCKKGELAFLVRSTAGNEGKIVQCLDLDPSYLFTDIGVLPAWRVNRSLPTLQGGLTIWVPDAWLRPIRPGDLQEGVSEVKTLEAA